jgi:hypothetical protein
VFDAIETRFTCAIKQTLKLLARAFSVRFADNSAGTAVVRCKNVWISEGNQKLYGTIILKEMHRSASFLKKSRAWKSSARWFAIF